MLTARVIPCLDIRDGRVVKGVRFQGLRDAGDPAELAARYEAQGADELVLLDVSATPEGRGHAVETVKRVRRVLSIPLTVGGGVRTLGDAQALLEAGADKVSINTQAVTNPELVRESATKFGSQCIVVAIDAKATQPGRFEVFTHGGRTATGLDAVEWAKRMTTLGAGEILLTSMDRDGTRAGYNIPLTRAVANAVTVPVIASGGVGTLDHLVAGVRDGHASAVLAASIFHYGTHTVGDAKAALKAAGLPVR